MDQPYSAPFQQRAPMAPIPLHFRYRSNRYVSGYGPVTEICKMDDDTAARQQMRHPTRYSTPVILLHTPDDNDGQLPFESLSGSCPLFQPKTHILTSSSRIMVGVSVELGQNRIPSSHDHFLQVLLASVKKPLSSGPRTKEQVQDTTHEIDLN